MNTLLKTLELYLSTIPDLNGGCCGQVVVYISKQLSRLNIPHTICLWEASLANFRDVLTAIDSEKEIIPYMHRRGVYLTAGHMWIKINGQYDLNRSIFSSDFEISDPAILKWAIDNLTKSNSTYRRSAYWNDVDLNRKELYHRIRRIFNCFG